MNASLKPSPNPTGTIPLLEVLRARLKRLNLYGLLAQAEEIRNESWLQRVLEIEEGERQSRSLKRRFGNARLLKFKSIADFDYAWPKKIDRELLEELLTLDFFEQASNVILVGPNGVGKTMIAKNPLQQAVLRVYSARFVVASDIRHELAAQDSLMEQVLGDHRLADPVRADQDDVGGLV